MSYQQSARATQWTVSKIASTQTARQYWIGMKRDGFVWAGTPHCLSSQIRTYITCFSILYQIITSSKSVVLTHNRWTTIYGLMLTLARWTTLIHGIGSTASLQVAVMHCSIYLSLATVVEELFLFMFVCLFVCLFAKLRVNGYRHSERSFRLCSLRNYHQISGGPTTDSYDTIR